MLKANKQLVFSMFGKAALCDDVDPYADKQCVTITVRHGHREFPHGGTEFPPPGLYAQCCGLSAHDMHEFVCFVYE